MWCKFSGYHYYLSEAIMCASRHLRGSLGLRNYTLLCIVCLYLSTVKSEKY